MNIFMAYYSKVTVLELGEALITNLTRFKIFKI